VLPTLERHHDVLAPTLAGHRGGPVLPPAIGEGTLADAVELAMDAAGFATAHLVGNSLGGYVALQLAARGRAASVVAFAPAGGWAVGDDGFRDTLQHFTSMQEQLRGVAPHVDALVATPAGRRQATRAVTVRWEHLAPELVAHLVLGAAACPGTSALIERAALFGWPLLAERVTCPLRIVWGTEDQLLPWPAAAHRFRHDWFPTADWIELEGVGHCPQLDVPVVAAELVVSFTARRPT
jgi:pimeloyl-ACP methyl ester carboxylesterase